MTFFKKRYAFILLIVAGVLVMLFLPPVVPVVQLPGEALPMHFPAWFFGGPPITNTLTTTAFVDVLLIILGLYLWRANKRMVAAEDAEERAPRGLHNSVEALFDYLWNQTEDTASAKWAPTIFPLMMTIILMVVLANWMELLPAVDSVGILEPSPTGEGYAPRNELFGVTLPFYYLDGKTPQVVEMGGSSGEEAHHGVCEEACTVLPVMRVASTDLNFTLALALVSVVMTQIIGFRALGFRYLTKFFNFGTLFTNPLGLIDVIVGLLELVSDFAKILSFSFRLLGNIFAGSILLFVISKLAPPFFPWIIAFLELFVGAIQAYVFGMLTLTFMSMATVHHGPGEEH